jgi:hypothetical protein
MKSLILLLLSATLALGQTVVIGVTAPGTNVDGQNGNGLLGQSVTLKQPAVLQSQSMKIINPAGQLVMGIYDASGPNGSPGKLLAQTVGFTPVAGVNTQPYTTPVFAAPANYWLVYSPSDNALSFDVQTVAGGAQFCLCRSHCLECGIAKRVPNRRNAYDHPRLRKCWWLAMPLSVDDLRYRNPSDTASCRKLHPAERFERYRTMRDSIFPYKLESALAIPRTLSGFRSL